MSDAEIDDWETSVGFESFVKNYKSSNNVTELNSEFEFGDYYFARILNKYKIVPIGEWLFKIEPRQEKVYAMHQNNMSDYLSFQNGVTVQGSVVVLPTGADVLGILSAVPPPNNGGPVYIDPDLLQFGLFCRDKRADKDISTDSQIYTGNDGVVRRFDGRLQYYRYGVYFSLLFAGEHLRKGWTGVWVREEVMMDYGFTQIYVKRCNGGPVRNFKYVDWDWTAGSAVMRSYKFQRCWDSMSALKEYFLEAAFVYREAGGSNVGRALKLLESEHKHIRG
jgi:hypothetical protein